MGFSSRLKFFLSADDLSPVRVIKSTALLDKKIPDNVPPKLHPKMPFSFTPLVLTKLAAFTVMELLITLSVMAIVLMLAIPSFKTLLLNNRLNANVDSLANNLNYARGVALNDAMTIKVCPLGTANSTVCGANWSSGWIVVTQPSTGTATLLKSQQNPDVNPTVSANQSEVNFNSHGLADNQINFTFCDTRGAQFARSLEVMATGFIQSGSTVGQAVWNNAALACP
jgi:type IV fimbrial biogenesis protein FimT